MEKIAEELQFAAARGDAFAALCMRDARSFAPLMQRIKSVHHFGSDVQLLALVDYASLPDFHLAAAELQLQPHPLMSPNALPHLRKNGGHLVAIPDADTFEKVFRLIWGRRAGVFVQTRNHVPAILDHLRSFTVAMRADGELALFRFYDPRVFAALLKTIDEVQYRAVFDGKIDTVFFETDRSELAIATFGPELSDVSIELC